MSKRETLRLHRNQRLKIKCGDTFAVVRLINGHAVDLVVVHPDAIAVGLHRERDIDEPADVRRVVITRRTGESLRLTFPDGSFATIVDVQHGTGKRRIQIAAARTVHVMRSELKENAA